MDNTDFTYDTAHPNAQALMKEDFFWNPIEETAPFGSDDGADAAYRFGDWRRTHKSISPVSFLRDLIKEWNYPYFDPAELDPSKILAYSRQDKELNELEIQNHIELLKQMNANLPDTVSGNMDDEKLREIVLSSTRGLYAMYLLGQDNAIIGTGFAQLVMEGRIDHDLRTMVITAIRRQLLPLLINQYDEGYRATRIEQLTKMLEVVDNAPMGGLRAI